MRKSGFKIGLVAIAAVALTGCMDAERKLGRGVNNFTEFRRMGELQRSIEQTTLWDGPAMGRTTGVIHGMNRTFARTAVGAFEILTFPFPSDPIIKPEWGVEMDSYTSKHHNTPSLSTENYLGFSQGEAWPILPGTRFRIFD